MWLLFYLGLAAATALIAARKGRRWPGWLIFGLIFPLFALIAVLLVSSKTARTAPGLAGAAPAAGLSKICPYCAAEIRFEAKVCPACGREQPARAQVVLTDEERRIIEAYQSLKALYGGRLSEGELLARLMQDYRFEDEARVRAALAKAKAVG